MSLTIAHPIVVLPFRRWLPLSALIVGSMTPDFIYVINLSPRGKFGHTIPGLFLFCLPASLIILYLLHRVWLPPFFAGSQRRESFSHWTFGPTKHFLALCAAIIIGAITHDAWDSFTHESGWAVQRFQFLSETTIATKWGAVHLYKILQHGSTVLGTGILAFIAIRRRKGIPTVPSHFRKPLFFLVCGNLVLSFGYSFLCSRHIFSSRYFFFQAAGIATVVFFAMIIVEATAMGVGWRVMRNNRE